MCGSTAQIDEVVRRGLCINPSSFLWDEFPSENAPKVAKIMISPASSVRKAHKVTQNQKRRKWVNVRANPRYVNRRGGTQCACSMVGTNRQSMCTQAIRKTPTLAERLNTRQILAPPHLLYTAWRARKYEAAKMNLCVSGVALNALLSLLGWCEIRALGR